MALEDRQLSESYLSSHPPGTAIRRTRGRFKISKLEVKEINTLLVSARIAVRGLHFLADSRRMQITRKCGINWRMDIYRALLFVNRSLFANLKLAFPKSYNTYEDKGFNLN